MKQKFYLKKNLEIRNLDDSAIIYNKEDDTVFYSNDIVLDIIKIIEIKSKTIEDIIAEIARIYDIEIIECSADITSTVEEMYSEGILGREV